MLFVAYVGITCAKVLKRSLFGNHRSGRRPVLSLDHFAETKESLWWEYNKNSYTLLIDLSFRTEWSNLICLYRWWRFVENNHMKCISKENVHYDEIFKILPHKANILNIKAQWYFFNVSSTFYFFSVWAHGRWVSAKHGFFKISFRCRFESAVVPVCSVVVSLRFNTCTMPKTSKWL